MAVSLVLSDSARIRYVTGAVMYFAQGIPQGLLAIALPAWMASQGATAADVGSYLAVIVLPWAFKLLSGPLMDRYQLPSMGRRKPWVLAAQLGLTVSLLGLMLIENPAEQVGLLMVLGVLINTFAATQDVAVDGMCIDLTPVREQGRLNAFMSFGKAAGWSATAAVSGVLLATFGMKVTAIAAASLAGLLALAFVLVTERPGERRLPWSRGKAATGQPPEGSFGTVFKALNQVLWSRASLVVMVIMFVDGLVTGYGQALMPFAAVNLFGYTTPEWSQLVAMMGLVGAAIALTLGPLVDRFGAKRMLILTVSLVAIHAFLIAQTQQLWEDSTYVRVMLSLWIILIPVVMVCVIALAMALCSSSISATQFAIYMSVANLGHSAGSKVYGMLAERASYVESYTFLGAFVVLMIITLLFHRAPSLEAESEDQPIRRSTGSRYTVGLGGSEAGLFLSGAMRCPKCRADMDALLVNGVEIDRCSQCQGLWFDAGEVERLRDAGVADAIDLGEADQGRKTNVIDRYDCPRCSGEMIRMVDPDQRHIWFEQCSVCTGSFFDAGEFRDLATKNLSDLVKGLFAPERK